MPAGAALVKLLLHLPVLHRFGFHHDELYFIACGDHLSFGYVDHAPLVPWIARLATTVFGESLVGLRIFATLAGALTIFLIGMLASRMGGGRFAQLLACLAWLVAPVSLRTGNMLAIPSFEPLFWVACAWVLVRIADEGSPRLWPWLGLIAGGGLLNKHSMLFFGFGLAVGLLATPLRRHLRTPWPWMGAGVALLLFLPNIVWQVQHGWPTASFLRSLNETVMAGVSKLQFVGGQLLYMNPFAAFVALLLFGGILFSPLSLPYLSIQKTDRFVDRVTFGAMGNIYELTGDLHGMFGWPERIETVAAVWEQVPAAERSRTLLFAAGYGNAGAIDFLGREHGLPRAVSLDKTYWMWGLPEGPIDTVIAVGFPAETLKRIWEEVEVVRSVELQDVNPWSTPFQVAICRKPRVPLHDLWARNRPW